MPVTDIPRPPRSPLKEKPLRNPGQSVDEMIDTKVDGMMLYVLAAGLMAITAWTEFFRWWRQDTTFHPWLYSGMTLVAASFATYKYHKTKSEIRLAKQGRDGERIVAEELEPLREAGYEILHDVVGGNFNIDHIVIGPAGVFVIETKTWSKRGGREEKLHFDGEQITLHGKPLRPDPLDQARANAGWIWDLLKASTRREFPVTPVVLFPGWYVEQDPGEHEAMVLNSKSLPAFLKRRPVLLDGSQASMAAFHLKQFIRSK